MEIQGKYLDELTPETNSYKVKVTVVEKGKPQVARKLRLIYQSFVLEDDKNNKMRCTLFGGEQIEAYEDLIQLKGQYEISNALVVMLDEPFQTNPGELPLQLTVDQRTVIHPTNPGPGMLLPEYLPLGSIPRTIDGDSKYDVVAVVLLIEERPREVISASGRINTVREIVITDQSNPQPITVSVWNALTEQDCERLRHWAARFQVVGFTSLRPVTRRGFALTSGMTTRIIHNPKGDRANVLREWSELYATMILDRQARVLQVRYSSYDRILLTMDELKLKKAYNALQDERFWLRVTIPDPELNQVSAYIGCSTCSKWTTVPFGTQYQCSVCRKPECVSTNRVTFTFEATDGTGTMSFTTLNDDTEKLFGKTASEICYIKEMDDQAAFQYIWYLLQTKPVLIKIGPTSAYSRDNVLKWQLKGLELERTTLESDDRASLNKINEELADLVDCSEESKCSQNKELALFYYEKTEASEPVAVDTTPKKEIETRVFTAEGFTTATKNRGRLDVGSKLTIDTPPRKETLKGGSSTTISDQP